MLYFERGSATDKLTTDDLRAGLFQALDKVGPRQRVLVIPPDFTRFHSHAGPLTKRPTTTSDRASWTCCPRWARIRR